jgi:hypothetical protein
VRCGAPKDEILKTKHETRSTKHEILNTKQTQNEQIQSQKRDARATVGDGRGVARGVRFRELSNLPGSTPRCALEKQGLRVDGLCPSLPPLDSHFRGNGETGADGKHEILKTKHETNLKSENPIPKPGIRGHGRWIPSRASLEDRPVFTGIFMKS